MEWAALIAWVLTAGGGFILLGIWLSRGGLRQARERGSRIRPPLIFGHFLLAATGLVLWLIYLWKDSDALAWIALVLLAIVAVLGWIMFGIWLRRRQLERHGVAQESDPEEGVRPAEQHFPVAIVALHGVAAVTTVVLVLLAAALD